MSLLAYVILSVAKNLSPLSPRYQSQSSAKVLRYAQDDSVALRSGRLCGATLGTTIGKKILPSGQDDNPFGQDGNMKLKFSSASFTRAVFEALF